MAPIYSRGRGTKMAAKARQVGKAILGPGPRKWLQKKRRQPESFSGLMRGGLQLGAKLRRTDITVVRSTPT